MKLKKILAQCLLLLAYLGWIILGAAMFYRFLIGLWG